MRLRSTRATAVSAPRLASPWAFYQDFTSGVLDPRVTFSRPSMALMFNSDGQMVYAPHNLVTWSEDFGNAAWVKAGAVPPVVTPNAALDPFGETSTASLIDLTTSSDARIAFTASSVAVAMQTTFSVWLRAPAGQGGTVSIQLRRADATTPFTTVAVTDQWQRFSFTASAAIGSATTLVWCGNRGSGGTLLTFYAWGAQLEISSTAGPYRRTAGAAFFGPRFEFDPSSLAPLGLRFEAEARSNLLANSAGIGGTASAAPTGWSFSSGLTSSTATYVYGTEDGLPYVDITLTGTNGSGSTSFPAFVFGSPTAGNSSQYALSLFARKIAGTTSVNIAALRAAARDTGGSSIGQGTTPVLDGSSLRTSRAALLYTTPAASTSTIQHSLVFSVPAGAVLDITLRVACPQIEVGTSVSSPILTTVAALTRAAEAATITGANFPARIAAASEYTLYATSRVDRQPTATTYQKPVQIYSTDTTSRVGVFFTGASPVLLGEVVNSGVFQTAVSAAVNTSSSAFHSIALRARTGSVRASVNGALTSASAVGTVPGAATVRADIGSSGFMGHIKAVGIAPSAMSDPELQALTA